jgi:hypothetical protein
MRSNVERKGAEAYRPRNQAPLPISAPRLPPYTTMPTATATKTQVSEPVIASHDPV